MRNCMVNEAKRLLWLKMRGDIPQKYEYIAVENITGQSKSCIYVKPWSQFFDLKGSREIPLSIRENITLRNIELKCNVLFDVKTNKDIQLSNLTFKNLTIEAENGTVDKNLVNDFALQHIVVNRNTVE